MPPSEGTTGREDFGIQYARSIVEQASGCPLKTESDGSELTVATIASRTADFILSKGPIDQVIVGGGGAGKPYFMKRLRRGVPRGPGHDP
jgi:1,6-anhydro-N-acetylmuramate kinase